MSDPQVIESLKLLSHFVRKIPKFWRLVTMRLPDGTTLTILHLPGGNDSGLRGEQARRRWAALVAEAEGEQPEQPLLQEIAS